ncbi:MAG: tyrosine-type recombinase/integrase [Gammaproteobacteria bacterium]|nr:tyrosine-type recombinase/integrase [Gammaproteobacteria bacterium]
MPCTRLTAAFVKTVQATEKPRRYGDGNGLYLLVKPGIRGGKSWVQRVVIHGVRRDLGLGSARIVTLKEAREVALDNLRLIRAGGDPMVLRKRGVPTFEEALETVIAMHEPMWKEGGRTADQWRASMREYALPRIGHKTVHTVSMSDVMSVLLPIWIDKHETARRVRRRIATVMKWAIAQGLRDDNPAGESIGQALPRVERRRSHQRALPYRQVGAALHRIRNAESSPGVRLVLEFMVLCAVRSGEARLATWYEVDFASSTWVIPPERMKNKREHRVPLSDRALMVLDEARHIRRGSLLFPSRVRGRAVDSGTPVKLMRDLRIDAVPHGFRSSFRDWAAEQTDTPHAVMEAALAHAIQNQVEAAYARSDLLDRRRTLMQEWADYLMSTVNGA